MITPEAAKALVGMRFKREGDGAIIEVVSVDDLKEHILTFRMVEPARSIAKTGFGNQ